MAQPVQLKVARRKIEEFRQCEIFCESSDILITGRYFHIMFMFMFINAVIKRFLSRKDFEPELRPSGNPYFDCWFKIHPTNKMDQVNAFIVCVIILFSSFDDQFFPFHRASVSILECLDTSLKSKYLGKYRTFLCLIEVGNQNGNVYGA